jgi:hypothetical protein
VTVTQGLAEGSRCVWCVWCIHVCFFRISVNPKRPFVNPTCLSEAARPGIIYSHFTGENSGSERLSCLCKVTKLKSTEPGHGCGVPRPPKPRAFFCTLTDLHIPPENHSAE